MTLYKMREHDDRLLARAGAVNVYGNKVETPINLPTSFNLDKLLKLRRSVNHLQKLKFAQPIMEISRFYSEEKLLQMMKSTTESIVTQVSDECSMANTSLFRPIISRDAEITDKLNYIFTEIQIKSEIDFITINDIKFNSSPEAFDKRIRETREYIEEHHDSKKYVSILPIIRLDAPPELTARKIKIAEDNGFEGIVFVFTSYYTPAWKSYVHIQKLSQDKEMWFHLAGCRDVWHANKKTSLPHILMLFGFDSFSTQPRRGGGKGKPTFKFKRFNSDTWGIADQSEWNNCRCPVCIGHKNPSSFINTYNGASIASQALNYHNLTVGGVEFMQARQTILHRELKEYMRKKKYAVEAVKKIFKIDLNQNGLDKWVKGV